MSRDRFFLAGTRVMFYHHTCDNYVDHMSRCRRTIVQVNHISYREGQSIYIRCDRHLVTIDPDLDYDYILPFVEPKLIDLATDIEIAFACLVEA